MESVTKNSEADLARQHATDDVRWALREMTANLLRVVRGAGKPHEIGRQAQGLIEAFISYREAVGTLPPAYELSSFLAVERDPEMLARLGDRELSRVYAEERVIRGALQVVASRLIGQLIHERAGEREMWDGINAIGAIRDETRKAMAAASAGRTEPRVQVTRRKKPKA